MNFTSVLDLPEHNDQLYQQTTETNNFISPYPRDNTNSWRSITKYLVEKFPIQKSTLVEIVEESWEALQNSKIAGEAITDFKVDNSAICTLVEQVIAKKLAEKHPYKWRRCQNHIEEKDIVCLDDPYFSFEIKVSGSKIGARVFGNKCYTVACNGIKKKKNKSGYYLTINFSKQSLTTIRFGWIDQEDWTAQKAGTGHQAYLEKSTYENKLIVLPGKYRRLAPIGFLVGANKCQEMRELGVTNIEQLFAYNCKNPNKVISAKLENYLSDFYY